METPNLSLPQLSEALRQQRVKLGYNVNQVADLASISGRTCVKIENDAQGVKFSTLKKVANVLGFNLQEKVVFILTEL